jgi:hypothetical protein
VYSAFFESDKGEKYVFGTSGNTVFDMDVGDGVSVNIGTSQGFSQVGVTVQTRNVSGRNIKVKGVIYGDVQGRKRAMRRIISPLSSGRLVFNERYYTRVFVKTAPSFSPLKDNGSFSLQFFAPFPYFYDIDQVSLEIGAVKPMFTFPVNYSNPHKFGEKGNERYKNIVNSGDTSVPFSLFLTTSGTSTNITIANLLTFKQLKLNGTLNAGEYINIYRDNDNVLRAELTSNGDKYDIISWIDESSELFELEVGDNLISANDDEGGASLNSKITFNPAVVALYET